MIRAGTPAATTSAGTAFVTTAPPPTMERAPTRASGNRTAPTPT